MKKLFLVSALLCFLVSNVFGMPFISTDPSLRVEKFEVTINDNIIKNFDPQINDSLIIDIEKDLGLRIQTGRIKISIVAKNSDGESSETSFYLRITKLSNYYVYKIEPIPEPDNQFYLDKYDETQLEVRFIKKR